MSAELPPKSLHEQHLHFDCVSGIAGDMTLGALIDLGVPAQVVRDAIAAVGIEPERLHVGPILKSGIASTNVWVQCDDESEQHEHAHAHEHEHEHEHAHGHGHHHHRYAKIRERIAQAKLSPDVIDLSLRIFDRVAAAEAVLHGTTIEDVAFHEVGAIDSIVDVVGSAAALCWLAPVSVSASPVAMGRGTIKCAHGILPVPSPAAVEIMRLAEAPMTDGGLAKELCTPTGAAILAATVTEWGSMPEMVPLAIGYGAGDIELPDRPNVLRGLLGRPTAVAASDRVVELEANIDDMSPEMCEHVAEELFAAGALDVWWTAIIMKKGRPALALRVLGPELRIEPLMQVVWRETSSIGLRFRRTQRRVLERENVTVETPFGPIAMKISRWQGELVNAAPEYESCRARARAHQVPLKEVFAAATCAYRACAADESA